MRKRNKGKKPSVDTVFAFSPITKTFVPRLSVVQSPRRSVFGGPLPSPRRVSTLIHRDVDNEVPSITMMFMQWGQFLDHDVTSVAQARAFNGSVPRCCHPSGRSVLPRELTHPECMPISVPETDNFYGRFGIGCLEFIRSAPTTRIDCELGHREQINQVTAYIDGSTIYGSDTRRAESLRTFRKGKLLYGRSRNRGPLNPPDPSGNELCRTGALSSACFTSGDGRSNEQPGLVAFHTVWLRYHNKLAETLSLVNAHWSDEKVYQESRRIVGALIQHITYSEFLPLLLGQDVLDIFGLSLLKTGYYKGYSAKVNPTPGNAFGAAAFRFGHSLVPNSYMRSDRFHRPLTNNVSLHNEPANGANIWPRGSLDRLLIGLADQGTQRRDEFVCAELTNHLFQAPHTDGFGMDLAAINVQRGRDHGLPAFTAWREPCGLRPIKDWHDLDDILRPSTVGRLRSIYSHVDDVDLYTAGLAERPVRGGIVGPTFACIIAQQFANLRRGDRFWYENGDYESSFTPAQLQRIRKIAFAHVLCQTTDEIDTIQRYAFLSADDALNARTSCADPSIDNFDVTPWIQKSTKADGEVEGRIEERVLVRFGDGADYSEESSEERSEKATKTDDNDDSDDSDDDDDDAEDDSDYYSDEDEDDDEEDSKGRKRPQKRKKKPPPPNRRVKNKAKKPTTRRPTIYYIKRPQDLDAIKIKLQNISSATIAVSNNQKRPTVYVTDRPQTTKRPLKIVPLSEYHQNLYSNLQYLRPTELTTTATRGPYDDVTYVMGHVVQKRPTTTLADEPFKDYNLNININYLIPTTTTTTSATASTGYYGNRPISDRYVTRRPEDSYSATVHRRPPTFVTSTPLLITDAPHSTGPKPITNPNNNDFHYGDSNNFFSDKYLTLINDRFAADKYPTQQRPVIHESATNAARPPSSSPSTIKYDRRPIQILTANGHPTDDSYTPNPIDYLTITSKRKYTTDRYYDRYATTTKPRPYPIRPLIDGLYGQTNSRPSSTYVHDNNHHEDDDDINNFPFPTHTDKQRPSYNSELTLIIDAKHKQSLNEIYKQVLNAAPNVLANKRPSFASFVSTTTYRPYESAFPDHGEKNFVKISAVRGGVYGEASRQEGKEGDFVLDDGDDVVVEEPDLLAIDVMPSEMKPEDWLRYGTDGDAGDFGRLPAFNLDAKCSDELPRPIASKLR